MKLYIPIILGTARELRESLKVAKKVFEFAKTLDIETELIDVKDFLQGSTFGKNDKIEEWRAVAKKADGFVFVTPEYNHGYPGELKIFFDNLDKEYNHKPVAYVGVSSGPIGGARAIEQLRLTAITLKMIPIASVVYFSNVKDNFDEQGNLKNSEDWLKLFDKLFSELIWYALNLREPRLKLNS